MPNSQTLRERGTILSVQVRVQSLLDVEKRVRMVARHTVNSAQALQEPARDSILRCVLLRGV